MPLACPLISRIAAISSFLRMPDVPLTPARLASARSSGSTMVASAPSDALIFALGVSVITGFDCVSLSLLSLAVMRSVSVTDFLSFPADDVTRGFLHSAKQSANCLVRPIIDSAT